ncbi:MAG: S-layer homology domain-containing protein [Clostridia bacterium]|nr:S-layer homology domain-containing protein [Clostridia bacterium]
MKIKKFLCIILAAVMLTGTVSVTAFASDAPVYSDVAEDMWSYPDIMYVSENGLMNGTGGTTFSPLVNVTRAMVVTVLYRMEGSPDAPFLKTAYADVADGQFYTSAVMWAKEMEIVTSTGMNENYEDMFSPDRAITREELATMFVRYAEYRYVITEKQADLSSFKDAGAVADWAKKAMAWCNGAGLINGTGDGKTLSPKMTATREQFAAIIHRFREAEFDYKYVLNEPKPLSTFTEPEYELVNDADVYVAVDGNDKNPGTLEKPVATFERAVELVRNIKKTAKDEIVVAFKAGNYGALELELTEADAGSASAPIVYRPYGDGKVVFNNGATATLDEFVPIDESDYKFFPEKNRSKIMKVDMSKKAGADRLTAMSPLFSESERIEMARFPNRDKKLGIDQFMVLVDSYETIKGGISSFTISSETGKILPNTAYGDYGTWACKLNSTGARIFDNCHTYENIVAVGMAGAEYDGDYITIDAYDKDTDTLTITTHDWIDSFGGFGGVKLFYMNISEELDAQGEYWFDPDGKTLYVYDPEYKEYYLGYAGTFIDVKDADHVSFVGFDFIASADDVIKIDADHVTVDNVNILGSGNRTFAVDIMGYDNRFVNSELSELSSGGIVIGGGDFEMLTPSNSVVDNNLIHDFGQIYQSWPHVTGIQIKEGVGVTLSHNEIYGTPHTAILFASIWGRSIDCIVEYNYIHDVILKYGDMGAVYCGRFNTERDNIVRYNILSNVAQTTGMAWGIYVDDGISGQTFYGNVLYNPGGYGFLHSGGRDNTIQDNVIIGEKAYPLRIWAKYAENLYANGQFTIGSWPLVIPLIKAYLPKSEEAMELWRERWPELFAAYEGPACTYENINEYNMLANSAGCVFKNNYSFLTNEHVIADPHNNKFNTFENNPVWNASSETADTIPHVFVNPAQGDYTLRDDCELTFEYKYDFAKIGRY